MNWLQRYVDNVRTYLPASLREDVGNELYSDLQDQCDEMGESLGRPLTDEEVLALIEKRGHPMAVAAAYQPRRTLVSEPLFPLYLQVLKGVFALLALVSAAGVIVSLFAGDTPNFVGAAVRWFASVYESSIHAFAWITLGFYLIGESLGYRRVFAKWNPRSLPQVTDGGRRIKRFDTAVEFAMTLLFMAWLNNVWMFPVDAGGLKLSQEFGAFLPWVNVALGASVAMSLVKLLAPYWTKPRLFTNVAIDIYWLALLALLLSVYPPFSLEWQGGNAWQPSQSGWRGGVAIVIAITAWDLLKNLRVLIRVSAESRAQ